MVSLRTTLAFFAASCFVLGITSCTELVDDPGTLPYYEKLVVRGVLQAGTMLDTLLITRTLPPLDEYSLEKAVVQGALVVVRHNGLYDTLRNQGKGRYFTPNIAVQSGSVYELTVEWKGKKAYATTSIPFSPTIQSVYRTPDQSSRRYYNTLLVASIVPRSNEVYGATAIYRSAPPNNYTYHNSSIDEVKYSSDTTSTGVVLIHTEAAGWYEGNGTDFIQVHVYDPAFYPYFMARYNNGDDDSPFGQNNSQGKWNVRGDGIGMFIGRASSPLTEVPR